MKHIKYTVGVTGLNATDNPAPGVPVIRSIKSDANWKGKIIGLAYDALDTGIYNSDLMDEVYLIPYPSEGEGNLLSRLKYISEKTGLSVIIPTLDSELVNFVRIEQELKKINIQLLIPNEEKLKLRQKTSLNEFCKQNGFDMPDTVVITDPSEVARKSNDLGFPLAVKGIFYESYTAYTIDEALVYFYKIKNKWGIPIILQKYVNGEEYDVVSLGDTKGKMKGAVAMRKLRITDKGKAWAGVTIMDEKLLNLAKNILEKLKWVGPIEMEFVKDASSRKYYLLEINPRFPSWVYLATKAGQNLPLATLLIAMGENVLTFEHTKPGLTFVRHAIDLVCPIKYLEELTTKGELVYSELED
jgi:carbamoyl-phosphate synthase large subunit